MGCALVAFPPSGSLYKFIYEVQVCAAQTVIVRSDDDDELMLNVLRCHLTY